MDYFLNLQKLNYYHFIAFSIVFLNLNFHCHSQTPAKNSNKAIQDSIDHYMKRGQYALAVPFAKALINELKKEDTISLALGTVYNSLGKSLMNSGNLGEAEEYLFKALNIRTGLLGDSNLSVAVTLNDIGAYYYFAGEYPKSEPYYLRALKMRKKILGEENPEVAISFNNLGLLYMDMGNFPKAEPFFEKALDIRKKTLGSHPYVADSYNNLGLLFYFMGSYKKTEPLYQNALQIRIQVLGAEHPDVAASFVNLGELYMEMGKYSESEQYYLKGLDLWKKSLGDNHPDLAISYNSLAILFRDSGKFLKAEEFFLKAEKIRNETLGQFHLDVAFTKLYLAGLYQKMGLYDKAEQNYLQALDIHKKALGENHPVTGQNLHELGLLYFQKGENIQSKLCFMKGWENSLYQFEKNFPYFSEEEKTKFLSKQEILLEVLKSFLINQNVSNPSLTGNLYDQQLFTKAILLNSQLKWKRQIKNSGDPGLIKLFNTWEATRTNLSRLYASKDSSERLGISSLEKRAEKLEKILSQRSTTFAMLTDRKQIVWQEIQKSLKTGEAAIEIIRSFKYGTTKFIIDTSDILKKSYSIQGLSDSVQYVALIVKKDLLYPEMVILNEGNKMEQFALNNYKRCIERQKLDSLSYATYWKAISDNLGTSIKKIYFSPDGVFHSLNLNTLFNPQNNKYLLDEKEVQIVTSSKDLVEKQKELNSQFSAVLMGAPDFYFLPGNKNSFFSILDDKNIEIVNSIGWKGIISDLPGTETEIKKIGHILEQGGWNLKIYLDQKANEENLKKVIHPKLLHLATHGFFQTDSSKESNPLLRSGLLLTSSGSTLDGYKSKKGEDGILTAYEAMNLDLENTDLVVLSACETGVGQLKNGEGVFGIQRAFKVAGAKSTIMSLWKVDDDATQELMVNFYKNWLGSKPKGKKISIKMSKRHAFLKAQKELKVKYPNPYYWGAFVMVGE
jgi:CHAT domain-containing protein/Tfp pilus assembly protein PilF